MTVEIFGSLRPSELLLPLITAGVGGLLLFGKKDYYGAFLRGANGGMRTVLGLFPVLCALLTAVSMLRASGAVDAMAAVLSPVTSALGIPSELLPLLLTRPFSGSASTATLSELLERVGADSFVGLCASVIFGSSDTVVYIITVYASAAGLRRTRWALPLSIFMMLFCVFFSCFFCRLWFK